ncbi:MAG: hypothetical protein ACI4WX_06215 [Aristaeellaceae bacterium]
MGAEVKPVRKTWSSCQLDFVKEFIVNHEEDIAKLPSCCIGSTATVTETNNQYVCGKDHVWKLKEDAMEEGPGEGGSSGGGATTWDDLGQGEIQQVVLLDNFSFESIFNSEYGFAYPYDYATIGIITVGQSYKVQLNGEEYDCIAYVDDYGKVAIGNSTIFGGTAGNNEPFGMEIDNYGMAEIVTKEAGNYTMTVSTIQPELFTCPAEYLPKFDANSEYQKGVISPVDIITQKDVFKYIGSDTTRAQLESRNAVFDGLIADVFDSVASYRFLRLYKSEEGSTNDVPYIQYRAIAYYSDGSTDNNGMQLCDIRFFFDGDGDDAKVSDVQLIYPKYFFLTSSTVGSSKQFKIAVDDSGTLIATEVT